MLLNNFFTKILLIEPKFITCVVQKPEFFELVLNKFNGLLNVNTSQMVGNQTHKLTIEKRKPTISKMKHGICIINKSNRSPTFLCCIKKTMSHFHFRSVFSFSLSIFI